MPVMKLTHIQALQLLLLQVCMLLLSQFIHYTIITEIGFRYNEISGAAANYMTPYTYTALPQTAGMAAAVANGIHGLSPYQSAGGLQEARLQ